MHIDPQSGVLHVTLSHGVGLKAADKGGTSDPYVVLKIGEAWNERSRVIQKTLNPRWDTIFSFQGDFDALCRDNLRLSAWDHNRFGISNRLGDAAVDLRQHPLGLGSMFDVAVDLDDGQAAPGKLYLALRWESAAVPPSSSSGVMHLRLSHGEGLRAADRNGLSDPYVKLSMGDQRLCSRIVKRTLAPRFDEDFYVRAASLDALLGDRLDVEVYDYDAYTKDDLLGKCSVDCDSPELRHGKCVEHTVALAQGSAKHTAQGTLTVLLAWRPHEAISTMHSQIEQLVPPATIGSMLEERSRLQQAATAAPLLRALPPPRPLPPPPASRQLLGAPLRGHSGQHPSLLASWRRVVVVVVVVVVIVVVVLPFTLVMLAPAETLTMSTQPISPPPPSALPSPLLLSPPLPLHTPPPVPPLPRMIAPRLCAVAALHTQTPTQMPTSPPPTLSPPACRSPPPPPPLVMPPTGPGLKGLLGFGQAWWQARAWWRLIVIGGALLAVLSCAAAVACCVMARPHFEKLTRRGGEATRTNATDARRRKSRIWYKRITRFIVE